MPGTHRGGRARRSTATPEATEKKVTPVKVVIEASYALSEENALGMSDVIENVKEARDIIQQYGGVDAKLIVNGAAIPL